MNAVKKKTKRKDRKLEEFGVGGNLIWDQIMRLLTILTLSFFAYFVARVP